MLNLKNKIPTKIVAIIAIQSFLFTGVIYPESISNNKDIAGIYKIDGKLRVPMVNSGKEKDDFAKKFLQGAEALSQGRSEFKRDDLISGNYLDDLKVPKGLLGKIGIEDNALGAQILVLTAEDLKILNGDPATKNIFKENDETKAGAMALLPKHKDILDTMKSKLGIEGNFSLPLVVAAEYIDLATLVHELTHVDKEDKGEIYKYPKNIGRYITNSHEKEANLNSMLVFRSMYSDKSFYDYLRMKEGLNKGNFPDERIKKTYLKNSVISNKPTPYIVEYLMWESITKELGGKNITEADIGSIKNTVFKEFDWYEDLWISMWSKKNAQHQLRFARLHPAKKIMDILELNENDIYLDLAGGPGTYTWAASSIYNVKEAIYLDISEQNVMITKALLANFDNINQAEEFGIGNQKQKLLTRGSANVLFLLEMLCPWGAALGNIPDNATVIQGDARNMTQIKDNSITKLSVTELFNWLGGPEGKESCIKEILRVVKPGGKILLVYDFSKDADIFMEMFKKIAEENSIVIDVKKDDEGKINKQTAFIIDIIDKNASPAIFSLSSKSNSRNGTKLLTNKFRIGEIEYDTKDNNVMKNIRKNASALETVLLEQSGLNITFTIHGPPGRERLVKHLKEKPNLLQAILRSKALQEGELNQEITIVLADKYDYLGGDHRKNNLIILNASDLEEMLDKVEAGEIPLIFFDELLTSILSEELAHERGAEGDADTEQNLALEAGFNTKKVLKSQPNPEPLSGYIKFAERFGINVESEPGYLNYLKALNRYEDLDWTKKHARLVAGRTVVVGHMEMGLSKALLENLYKKLVNEKGYSEQDAELEVGNLAKLTMAGGLGNIKRELTESWAEKGADLISINILYGRRIQSLDYIKEDAVNNIIEMMGSPEMEFEVEIFDRNDVWQKIKTKVSIYRDPFSPFPNYWVYCPDVFDGSYPGSREHLAQQMLLYRKASLTLLEKLKEKGRVKDKFLFSLSEVYTAFLIPNAIKDEFKDNPVFKDIFIHHYNHTVVPEGMPKLPVTLWEFIGLNSERYGYSIIEGDKIVPAKIIGQEADEITGCSVLHTDILKTKVMADFKDKIPDDISEKNSEGAYLDNWQGGQIQKIIAKYYVKLGAENDEDLFNKLENAPDAQEAFIDDQMEAHKKQKDESMTWFNKQGMDLNSDSALVSVTRRLVKYKRVDMLVTILKDESYRKRFMKLGIAIIVGGREFENYSKEQIGALEQLAKDHPELGKCIFILSEHSDHAGYNIFMAPRIYAAVDATLMLSNKGQEAGPTSSSKGLSNGAAIIAVKDGVIPELLEQFNNATLEGNGFEVGYNEAGTPSLESLFKAFEDFSKAYKDEKSRRALAYNSLKTGMLKSNISTRQGPELINIWQEGLERHIQKAVSEKFQQIENVQDINSSM